MMRGLVGTIWLLAILGPGTVAGQSSTEAWAVADRLIESLGGREAWASARSLYVRETAYPASIRGSVTAEFWRDLEEPAYRSVITGPGVSRETRWSVDGGWTARDGVRSDLTEADLAQELAGWRQEPYVMYHKLAQRDPALHLAMAGENRLEIFDGQGGDLLCWFVVDESGSLLRWGNYFGGEVNEHVYGPLRDFGEIRMPRWGTSTTGSWRFEYEDVRLLDEAVVPDH